MYLLPIPESPDSTANMKSRTKPRLLNQAFAQAAAEKEKENQKSSTESSSLFGAAKAPIPKDEPIF